MKKEIIEKAIIIFDHNLLKIQQEKDWPELMTLLLVYNQSGNYQKTPQPWVNVYYLMLKTGWGHEKVYKYRKRLLELNLIKLLNKVHVGKRSKNKNPKIKNKKYTKIKNFPTIKTKKIIIDEKPVKNNENKTDFIKENKTIIIKEVNVAENPQVRKISYLYAYREFNKLNLKELYAYRIGNKLLFTKNLFGNPFFVWDSKERYFLNSSGIKRNHIKKTKTNLIKKVKRNPIKMTKTDPMHPVNAFYLKVATELRNINDAHYDHNIFPEPKNWVTPIRLLVQSDFGLSGLPNESTKKRLNAVVKHYASGIGKRYTHILKCGESFRKKFFDVEEAIKRKKNLPDSTSIKSKILKNTFRIHKVTKL